MDGIKKSSIRELIGYVWSGFRGNTMCDLGGIKRSDAVVTSKLRKQDDLLWMCEVLRNTLKNTESLTV